MATLHDAPVREMVSCYVRRFGGWTRLREAIARELGIGIGDVLDLDAGGGSPVYLQARTQHGDFQISLELFIDKARVSGYRGKAILLQGLARALGEDILCDDGQSTNPYRWVLVKPDGSRFEVFEDAGQPNHMLVLDRDLSQRPLLESTEDRDAYFSSREHLPRSERSAEELEWELAQGQLKFAIALDMAQDPGPEGFVWYGEWEAELKAEIARRKKSD